jgi:hypothetical protein
VCVTHLDGEIIDGASARGARTLERYVGGGCTLERRYACLQPCDLPFLLFELRPLVLDLLMCDGLSKSIWGIRRPVSGMISRIDVRTKFVKA